MKFISPQENLKKGLSIVSHITNKNVNLPILNNILIRTIDGIIEFISTNLEIGIIYRLRGKVEKEGEITVNSKLISEYIALLDSNENITISTNDLDLEIKCGKYNTKIKGEESKDFPLIPTIDKKNPYTCSVKDLKDALSSVSFAVSNSENRIELSGVLFTINQGKLTLAATDSYRLAEKIIDIKSDKKTDLSIIVPNKTVQEVLRILNNINLDDDVDNTEIVNIYINDNQILFTLDSIELISRIINGNYPDYKQIIPKEIKTEAVINKQEFIRAVKATSLFSKSGINDITLQFMDNKLLVSSFSGQSGESEVELEVDTKGENNDITVNYRFLLDGLNNINSDFVRFKLNNYNTPCLLQPEKDQGYLYIIMPIKQ